jgi:uncharacterized membrane protein
VIKPLDVWRWGFSLVLVGVGIWLLIEMPGLGGADARVLGWVIIAYAVVRLFLSMLSNSLSRRRRRLL